MADRTVRFRLMADVNDFQGKMAAASVAVEKAADQMTAATKEGAKFRAGLTTVGDTAGKVGLVAAAGLGAAIKTTMDWETAWVGVQKTVDATATTSLATLEGQLRGLARELPASHTEIAAVAEAAGQLGVSADDVASFTETMIGLGETTNLSAEDAATSIARFTNVMGTANSEVDRVGAAVVELGNNFATTEAEIVVLGQRMAAAGAIAGLSEADVLGFAAALSSVGVEAEAGGTAMSKVFTSMRDAVIDGGDKLEVFASTAGVTAQEFAAQWGDSPAQAIDAFIQGLGAMNEQGQSTSAVFRALGLTDQRLMRALLSTAEAGDTLTRSLGMSAEAWAENTALTDEFAKFLGTSSSQVRTSMNNIKDAAIEVGASMLPVVEGVAEAAAGMASAFSSLPGPVKSATGPLLGLTAIFGGGLWFTSKTINGVANMRAALTDLGPAGTKAATGLGRAGRAAGIAGASITTMLVAFEGVKAIQRATDETLPGVEALTSSLLDLAEAPDYMSLASIGEEFDSLGESIDRITDKNLEQKFADFMQKPFEGMVGESGSLREAKAEIEALDQALAGLAAAGGPEVAATAFERFADAQRLSASQAKELRGLLPGFDEALASVDNSARLAEGGVDGLGGAFGDAEGAVDGFANALDRLNGVLSGRAAMRDYESAIDSFTASIRENGRTFDITTEKGRRNQAALDDIAKSAIDVAEGLDEADRAEFLSRAMGDIRSFAQQMGIPKSEVRELLGLLREANGTNAKPNVEVVGAGAAGAALGGIIGQLNAIDGRRVRSQVDVITNRVTNFVRNTLPMAPGRADGGTVPTTGLPYADRHPYLLADGEEVISNRFGQADRWRPLLKAINDNRLADGGTVGRLANGGTARSIDDRIDILRLRQEIRQLTRSLNATGRDRIGGLNRQITQLELKAAKQRLRAAQEDTEAARERRKAIRDSVRGNVMGTDLFGGGDLASFDVAIRNQAAEAKAFEQAMKRLTRMGLSGDLLEEVASSGSAAFAQQLIGAGRRGIREYEQLYAQSNRSARRASRHVAQAALDEKSTRLISAGLSRVERAVRQQGREFGRELNHVSARGQRQSRAKGRGGPK